MNLQKLFGSIPDKRRKQGKRIQLTDLLWLVFLAVASGQKGYRGTHKFAQANRDFLIETFNLKHGIPSHVTFREVLMNIDKEGFITAFQEWAGEQHTQAGGWISGDGKALASTIINTFNNEQDFTATVSIFCQETGLTLRFGEYSNKTGNEQDALRELLSSLQGKQLILTTDAFHTQKKL
jgi:DDE_Tnp_1-associated